MTKMILLATAATLVVAGSPATAQHTHRSPTKGKAGTTTAPVPGNAEAAHPDPDQAVIVTGVRKRVPDVLASVSVLDEAELNRAVRPSLGDTLAQLPGVSATSFGPKASAPVLRGLQGERAQVLIDGLGSLDMSALGPDHEVAINTITAQSIEVLRGPSALLFSSSAIGGVVDVIDSRIPRRMPSGAIAFDGLALYGSAANERAINGSLNVPLGGHLVLHADGNYDKSDDLRIGGYVLSQPLRDEALASADPDVRALADLKGTLPHSAARTTEGALGLAYVDGALNLGVSVTRHTSRYQVPIRYSLVSGEPAEQPTLDPRQTRVDARAELPLKGPFSLLRLRGGYSKYHHDELNAEGGVDTSFFSNGGEGRLELVQRDRSGWSGTSGVQYLDRNARIRGDEKFLPDSREQETGLFTLQSYVNGPLRLEGAVRLVSSDLSAKPDAQMGTPAESAKFTTLSGSFGGQYEITDGWRAGLTISHSERAPAVDELFANGPHGGSEAFEVGNPDLHAEKSNGAELSLHGTRGPIHVSGSLYYNLYSNFIFQAPTGEFVDELPVYKFLQGKADYYGFELQSDTKFGHALGILWGGEVQADAVRATVKDFGPAPLIPPLRIMGALTGSRGEVDGRIELRRAFAHDRTAPNETDTPGYTMLNASLDWHPFAANPALTLSLQGNNLLDVDARRSTSLLKDYAPLAGRDIRLSARINF